MRRVSVDQNMPDAGAATCNEIRSTWVWKQVRMRTSFFLPSCTHCTWAYRVTCSGILPHSLPLRTTVFVRTSTFLHRFLPLFQVLLSAAVIFITDYTYIYLAAVLIIDIIFLVVNVWKAPCLVHWINQYVHTTQHTPREPGGMRENIQSHPSEFLVHSEFLRSADIYFPFSVFFRTVFRLLWLLAFGGLAFGVWCLACGVWRLVLRFFVFVVMKRPFCCSCG